MNNVIATAAVRPGICLVTALFLNACNSHPPLPDWQTNTKEFSERAVAAYLNGNAKVEIAEMSLARNEVRRTGRADLLARVELKYCAAQVASLAFGPCAGFDPLRADVTAAERAYADYLQAKVSAADIALLPDAQRALASGKADDASNAAVIAAMADPLSQLVAAGVLFESGNAGPMVIAKAIDAAASQGWRRPLLAWLNVQLKRAELSGAQEDAQRIKRRIDLVIGEQVN
jgi:hypothetical protein